MLVAFATKKGSTAEIAASIGQELSGMGLEADVLAVQEVGDLRPYGALILGSAVYFGKWRKQALGFAARHAGELLGMPVWLFESGPTDTSAAEGKTVPAKAAVELAQRSGARGQVTFGGSSCPSRPAG